MSKNNLPLIKQAVADVQLWVTQMQSLLDAVEGKLRICREYIKEAEENAE